LHNLKEFYLDFNSIDDITCLNSLSKLTLLGLSFNDYRELCLKLKNIIKFAKSKFMKLLDFYKRFPEEKNCIEYLKDV